MVCFSDAVRGLIKCAVLVQLLCKVLGVRVSDLDILFELSTHLRCLACLPRAVSSLQEQGHFSGAFSSPLFGMA